MPQTSSIKSAQATHSKRHRLKTFFIVSGIFLLAALVLWPYINEILEESDAPTPKVTVESIDLDKKRVTNPKIIGSDSENQPYTITAATAEQQANDRVIMDKVKGTLTLKDGTTVQVTARKGDTYAKAPKEVFLHDTVVFTYNKENTAHTEDAHINFKEGLIYGDNPIEGKGPHGVTSAQRFSFDYKKKVLKLMGDASLTIFNRD